MPKLKTSGSGVGLGLGLGEIGTGGSDGRNEAGAGPRKSRSLSGSSVSSLGAEEKPVIESSGSATGTASGVPIVPSSPAYPVGSTSTGPAYASGSTASPAYVSGSTAASSGYAAPAGSYSGAQGGYAQSGEGRVGYERSGSTYEQPTTSYEPNRTTYERSSSGYAQTGMGFDRSGAGYDVSGYDKAGSSGYAQNLYSGFESSGAGYAQGRSGYAGSPMASPSHIQAHPSPSQVQLQPLPSTALPLPGSSMFRTPVVGSSIHEASPTSNQAYFQNTPGMYPSRSMPSMAHHANVPLTRPAIGRRPTIVPSLIQREALGLSLGQPDTPGLRESMGQRPSDSGAGPPSGPSAFGFSSVQAESSGRQELKQEEGAAGTGMWSSQEVQGQPQGHGQERDRFQAGYQDGRWTGAGAGSEPAGYHGYHNASASGMVGSAGGYPYPQQQSQSQQQLYVQQGGAGFGDQQEQYRSIEGGGTYAEGSAPFGMQPGVEGNLTKLPHQQFPDYPWPGSESQWNGPSGFSS